jgi:peptidoglycan-associated lipoprotein
MLKTASAVYLGMVLSMIFWSGGCSSTATKPENSAPPAANVTRKGTKPEVRSAQAQGSLEDMRRGDAPATPKDSPLREIYFDFDAYDLRPDARATLKTNAEWLRKNPAVRVDIEGHCDERGTTEYNLALGGKRAQAAKDYLTALGVSPNRLVTTSYGEEAPVCRENREGCWQRNRRGRFVARAEKPGV